MVFFIFVYQRILFKIKKLKKDVDKTLEMGYYSQAHKRCADVAELADALDSGSSGHCARAGSSPVIRSNADKVIVR